MIAEGEWPWEKALEKFPLPCFSRNKSDEWIPTLSWFLKPDTVDLILEGNYDFLPESKKKRVSENRLPTKEDLKNYDPHIHD